MALMHQELVFQQGKVHDGSHKMGMLSGAPGPILQVVSHALRIHHIAWCQ